MTSAEETLAAAEASSIGLTSELAEAEQTIETLKNTLSERFTPLKEGTVTVKREQKKLVEAFLSDIQPAGLDNSLMDAMKVTFTKPLDARTKFDGTVLIHLETGIQKHLEVLAAKLANAEQEGIARKEAVSAAETTLSAARSKRAADSETLAAAEAERKTRAATSRQAAKTLRDHPSYVSKCEAAVDETKSQLERFLECLNAKAKLESTVDDKPTEEAAEADVPATEAQETAAAAEEAAAEADPAI